MTTGQPYIDLGGERCDTRDVVAEKEHAHYIDRVALWNAAGHTGRVEIIRDVIRENPRILYTITRLTELADIERDDYITAGLRELRRQIMDTWCRS